MPDRTISSWEIPEYKVAVLGSMATYEKVIISLFDFSHGWCRPYAAAGYQVIPFDIKDGYDINDFCVEYIIEELGLDSVYGILAAPPCTHFSGSGAQYWPAKDADGRTAADLDLVHQVLRSVEYFGPMFWAMENPVGRLNRLVPGLDQYGPWYFQPHFYGDPYTKKTGIWGEFNQDLKKNKVDPIKSCDAGSWLMQLGGKSEKTKALRSITPPGFSNAFYQANK